MDYSVYTRNSVAATVVEVANAFPLAKFFQRQDKGDEIDQKYARGDAKRTMTPNLQPRVRLCLLRDFQFADSLALEGLLLLAQLLM